MQSTRPAATPTAGTPAHTDTHTHARQSEIFRLIQRKVLATLSKSFDIFRLAFSHRNLLRSA